MPKRIGYTKPVRIYAVVHGNEQTNQRIQAMYWKYFKDIPKELFNQIILEKGISIIEKEKCE
jgi:hypothetical protein